MTSQIKCTHCSNWFELEDVAQVNLSGGICIFCIEKLEEESINEYLEHLTEELEQ